MRDYVSLVISISTKGSKKRNRFGVRIDLCAYAAALVRKNERAREWEKEG